MLSNLPSKYIASCDNVKFQFWIGMVHFFEAFSIPIYNSFIRLFSLGKAPFVLGFTLFYHSNITLPQRFENVLSKIIITPSIHWVHHHAIRKDTDSNYGTIFSFWDRIFETKSDTKRFETMRVGVQGVKDRSFIRLLLKPCALDIKEKNTK